MTPLQFQAGKFYRTRDGRKARIYATDGGYSYPMHGALNFDGSWRARYWLLDGRYVQEGTESDNDLIAEWEDAEARP